MRRTRAVPVGSVVGISGNGGCIGLAFWRFFSGRGLATSALLHRHALVALPLEILDALALDREQRVRADTADPGDVLANGLATIFVTHYDVRRELASRSDNGDEYNPEQVHPAPFFNASHAARWTACHGVGFLIWYPLTLAAGRSLTDDPRRVGKRG